MIFFYKNCDCDIDKIIAKIHTIFMKNNSKFFFLIVMRVKRKSFNYFVNNPVVNYFSIWSSVL